MEHVSVLFKESLAILDPKEGGIYVDLTLGRAGHSSAILSKLGSGHLYAFDLDLTAIEESREKLAKISPNFTLIHASFATLKSALAGYGVNAVDGILADLGVSSPQFDDASRGFSYREDAPLDMRMDVTQALSAKEVVNTYSLEELVRVLRDYGEEKDAYRIAKEIVKRRERSPLETTFDLVEAVKAAKSAKELSKKGHPAKQTFQAIRIEVNGEQEALRKILEDAPGLLRPGGKLAIISFMSLDDRMVKRRFQELSRVEGDRHGLPLLPGEIPTPQYRLNPPKAILPGEEELNANPRSASAKLRGLQRI